MPSLADSQIPHVKVCPAVLAGERIIQALKSWERELELEIDPNLAKIVKPLTTAFVDSKTSLAKANLENAVHCRQQFEQVVEILQGINNGVSAPWNEAEAGGPGFYALLSEKWKDVNPLSHMRKDIEVLEAALNAIAKQKAHGCHGCILHHSASH